MSKLTYAMMASVDRYIEDSNGSIGWTKPGEDLHRHFNDLEKHIEINSYDRKMSETMSFRLTADQVPGTLMGVLYYYNINP